MKNNKERSVFAENLMAWRKKRGYRTAKDFYTQLEKECASCNADVPFSYMAYVSYENGSRTPKYEILVQLARFLDVSLDILLGLYDADYILHFLTKNEFHAILKEDQIYIRDNAGNCISTNADNILKFIQQIRERQEAAIHDTLRTLLRRHIQKDSLTQLQEAGEVVATSIATLLQIDYKALQTTIKGSSFFEGLNNNLILVLFFIYVTGCNPLDDLERATHLMDEYKHQMAEIMDDAAEKNVVKWKGFKIPGTNQIDAYEPEPRIPAIDRYMRIYMSIHKESNMGDSFEILKFNFFYYLNRRSRPMSSILL